LAAMLAALALRERTGRGVAIDLAMQDCAAWATQLAWNRADRGRAPHCVVACSDGHAVIEADDPPALPQGLPSCWSRAELVAHATSLGLAASPVRSVGEAAEDPRTRASGLLFSGVDAEGRTWPLLGSPVALSAAPPCFGP